MTCSICSFLILSAAMLSYQTSVFPSVAVRVALDHALTIPREPSVAPVGFARQGPF